MKTEFEKLQEAGFMGFIDIKTLKEYSGHLPREKGVYVVLRMSENDPVFLEKGSGGFFKGKNPNVSLSKLRENWIDDSQIMYIGQTTTSLQSRLSQYLRFGSGMAVGHYGGRYIWQLKDSDKLVFAWKTLPSTDTRAYERTMLQDFLNTHGALPFANLTL